MGEATGAVPSILHGGPLTLADGRQPGIVDDEMDAAAPGDTTQRQVEPLVTP